MSDTYKIIMSAPHCGYAYVHIPGYADESKCGRVPYKDNCVEDAMLDKIDSERIRNIFDDEAKEKVQKLLSYGYTLRELSKMSKKSLDRLKSHRL